MRIALLSDTHSHFGPEFPEALAHCDEIWHAGDIGSLEVADALAAIAPLVAVHGNIDDHRIRACFPQDQWFQRGGLQVFMTHIAGSPGRYNARVKALVRERAPHILVCGHSHILKVARDPAQGLWHLNPGAAGHHGFHHIRTMLTFTLEAGRLSDMAVVEFGRRGALSGGQGLAEVGD